MRCVLFVSVKLVCVLSQKEVLVPFLPFLPVLFRVVHFTTDAVNRHLTVRRNLRFGPSQIELQA